MISKMITVGRIRRGWVLLAEWFESCVISNLYFLPKNQNVRYLGIPCIAGKERMRVGKRFRCVSRNAKNSIGVQQATRITIYKKSTGVFFGDDCGISGVSISSRAGIYIGNRVLMGAGALIMDNDAHGIEPGFRNSESHILSEPIQIEDDAFIGARSIILKGVTIGRGAIVAAGAVVTKSVPDYAVVAGNPSRVVKLLRPAVD